MDFFFSSDRFLVLFAFNISFSKKFCRLDLECALSSDKCENSCPFFLSFHILVKENLFVSGSYNNTVKVWDVRATVPLFTIGDGENKNLDPQKKIFAVNWANDDGDVVFGGTEKKLRF